MRVGCAQVQPLPALLQACARVLLSAAGLCLCIAVCALRNQAVRQQHHTLPLPGTASVTSITPPVSHDTLCLGMHVMLACIHWADAARPATASC